MTPGKLRKSIFKDFKCHIIESQDIKSGCNKCVIENEFSLCKKLPFRRGIIKDTIQNRAKNKEIIVIQSNISNLLLNLGRLEKRWRNAWLRLKRWSGKEIKSGNH